MTGGVCGIFGIRNAGLAISVGTWSSVTVVISFIWGIAFFDEKLKSMKCTIIGLIMLLGGFVGMTFYSSPNHVIHASHEEDEATSTANNNDSLQFDSDLTERLIEQVEAELEIHNNCNEVVHEHLDRSNEEEEVIHVLGIPFSRRQMGILGAASDGLLGGSNLVPMHYSV